MQDSQLKNLLLETCPVRPGQEERAWIILRDRLQAQGAPATARNWIHPSAWRGWAVACVAISLIPVVGLFAYLRGERIGLATADSKSPGIYATAFYSHSAQAQVVWLNGMEPVSDKPSYMDPTTAISDKAKTPETAHDPNSL